VYRVLKEEYGAEMAMAEFQKALDRQVDNYSALLDMGLVYLSDLKDTDQAEAYFRQALTANDQSPYAYLYIGDVYRERGDKGSAIEWYQQALEHKPDWQTAVDRLKAIEGNDDG
jgi:tetratricopeptide (TPR) repeat protein